MRPLWLASETKGPEALVHLQCCHCPAPGGTTHHFLESPQDSCCDDAQEQAQHVQHGRGPEQTVEVEHVLTAADAHELVVRRRVLSAARGERATLPCLQGGHLATHVTVQGWEDTVLGPDEPNPDKL